MPVLQLNSWCRVIQGWSGYMTAWPCSEARYGSSNLIAGNGPDVFTSGRNICLLTEKGPVAADPIPADSR